VPAPAEALGVAGVADAGSAADAVAWTGGDAQALLRELVPLLAQSDLEALQVHAQLQRVLPATRRGELDEAMAILDFQAALAHCRGLLGSE
jgi:hypothetical protein